MAQITPTIALVLSQRDHVGVVLDDVSKGGIVEFRNAEGTSYGSVVARTDIPFGHKIARESRRRREQLLRYGQPIGIVTAELAAGDHVHTHNLISKLSLHE
jgi:SAF domain-containing protein